MKTAQSVVAKPQAVTTVNPAALSIETRKGQGSVEPRGVQAKTMEHAKNLECSVKELSGVEGSACGESCVWN
ncbi:hypothetical protein HPL003_02350 [Paenibacillus terrae HPL-003]|uniref:Uncharacterized protein n=1 Tax=Paenibacillus terrae (strain HPL-003) TaxID=985665 RepID=G7VZK9_PAETH|nr:hypothetical protein HPL003_02350 [Paenibacillus terrae HPL-003]